MTDIRDYHARGLIPDLETQMEIEQLLEQNQGNANFLEMGLTGQPDEDDDDDAYDTEEDDGSLPYQRRQNHHIYGAEDDSPSSSDDGQDVDSQDIYNTLNGYTPS